LTPVMHGPAYRRLNLLSSRAQRVPKTHECGRRRSPDRRAALHRERKKQKKQKSGSPRTSRDQRLVRRRDGPAGCARLRTSWTNSVRNGDRRPSTTHPVFVKDVNSHGYDLRTQRIWPTIRLGMTWTLRRRHAALLGLLLNFPVMTLAGHRGTGFVMSGLGRYWLDACPQRLWVPNASCADAAAFATLLRWRSVSTSWWRT